MASRPANTIADGFDASTTVDGAKAAAATISGHPVKWVMRYVSKNSSGIPHRQITSAERADLHAHNLSIILGFELTTGRPTAGRQAGRDDANAAFDYMSSLGAPVDMPCFWAADQNYAGPEIADYARGWIDVAGL